MGNFESSEDDDFCSDWKFVGRKNDIDTIIRLQQNTRVVGIFGIKKIGKSRTAIELLKRLKSEHAHAKFLYHDFELNDAEGAVPLYECLCELFDALGVKQDKFDKLKDTDFESCENCKKCRDKKGCEQIDSVVRRAKLAVKEGLKAVKEEIVVCIDNVDNLIQNDIYLDFFKEFAEFAVCKRLKCVVTSTYRLNFTGKWFGVYELWPLEDNDIVELLHEVAEDYLEEEEDKRYVDAIACLCEGLPLAALMAGSELKNDSGLLKPSELVELLITDRLDAMSQKHYPADDRLDQYKDPIEKANERSQNFKQFFNRLNMRMTGSTFSVGEAADAVNNTNASSAAIKRDYLIPLLNQHIVVAQRDMIVLHGIFRDCITTLVAIEPISGEIRENFKTNIYDRMRDHARSVGLDVDEKILRNPKVLERAIRSVLGGAGSPESDSACGNFYSLSGPTAMLYLDDMDAGTGPSIGEPSYDLLSSFTGGAAVL